MYQNGKNELLLNYSGRRLDSNSNAIVRSAKASIPRLAVKVLVLLGGCAAATAAESSLLDLIRAGNMDQIESALKSGADANSRDERGVTALMYAAAYLPANGVQALLGAGADVNQASNSGATALMTAIGDPVKVRMLVEKGANVKATSKAGNTPLSRALSLPSGEDTARYLLGKGATPSVQALVGALFNRRVDIARKFLEQGVTVDQRVLGAAQASQEVGLVRMVLDRRPELVDGSRQLGKSTTLMAAAHQGSLDMARVLIEQGANVNAADTRGRTPLMYAAGADHPNADMIRLLLEKGADPAAKDNRGDTALDFSVQRGLSETIRAMSGTLSKITGSTSETFTDLPPVRSSLTRAMTLLDAAGPRFFKSNGCISCHNQSIPQIAAAALRPAGIKADTEHSKNVMNQFRATQDERWETDCVRGGSLGIAAYGLVGLGAEGEPRSAVTDQVVRCLAEFQQLDGSWGNDEGGVRPPLGLKSPTLTALAVRSMQLYPIPGREEDFRERIARARQFLQKTDAQDTQSLTFRILGLKWTGASESGIQSLVKTLSKLQRPDGGWNQNPEMQSDAYATGQALWALHEAGWKATDKGFVRGATYLRRMQKPDGSWYVRSRAFGFQPYRDTGFPHGHDQWISSAATGFAVLALAPLVEAESPVAASHGKR
jgi:ankyrin repeat protein